MFASIVCSNTTQNTNLNFFVKITICITLSLLIAIPANAAKGGNGKGNGGNDPGDPPEPFIDVVYTSPDKFLDGLSNPYEFFCSSRNGNTLSWDFCLGAIFSDELRLSHINEENNVNHGNTFGTWSPSGDYLLLNNDRQVLNEGSDSELEIEHFSISDYPKIVKTDSSGAVGDGTDDSPHIRKEEQKFRLQVNQLDLPEGAEHLYNQFGIFGRTQWISYKGTQYILALAADRYIPDGQSVFYKKVYLAFWEVINCGEHLCIGGSGEDPVPNNEALPPAYFANKVFQLPTTRSDPLEFHAVNWGGINDEPDYIVYKAANAVDYDNGFWNEQIIAFELDYFLGVSEPEELVEPGVIIEEGTAKLSGRDTPLDLRGYSVFDGGIIFNQFGPKSKGGNSQILYYHCPRSDEDTIPNCGCTDDYFDSCSMATLILDTNWFEGSEVTPSISFAVSSDGKYALSGADDGTYLLDLAEAIGSQGNTSANWIKISNTTHYESKLSFKPMSKN
ncbi:hypothetical protein RI845_13300 [Thalassotalea nanhaiensis]|uniref:Uncharacterized protein n=1 Tax=Thalassotalea nanhaiensis TaxID=3065648 RepID=A0ABY9TI59_9GAMM|nr:hypothetical protein RI845_13300 [Colwelliaceae bacterium SQ345]